MLKRFPEEEFDAEFAVEFVQTFLDNGQRDVEALQKAHGVGNVEDTGFWAHKIKGSARALSASDLSEKAALLEVLCHDIKKPSHLLDERVGEVVKCFIDLKNYLNKRYVLIK